jgi:transposase-like protein
MRDVKAGRRGPLTAEDHRRKCNHIACPACGLLPVRRWTKRHQLKGAVIVDATVDVLLTWPDLPIHSGSIPAVVGFLDGVNALFTALHIGDFGRIDGFVGATQYNPPPFGGFGKVQGHLHLSVLPGRLSLVPLVKAIKSLWLAHGGKAVHLRQLDENGIGGVIQYLNCHPLEAFRAEAERVNLHHRVLNAVEAKRKAPAAVRAIGGPALSSNGFQMIRARARHTGRRHSISLTHVLEDPDRKAMFYCPTVRQVCPVEACPACKSFGRSVKRNGRTKGGTPRWRCKKCGKSWVERSILAGRNRAWQTKGTDARIRRCWSECGTIAGTARRQHVSEWRVRRALRHADARTV